jgi:hypothetical protein
MAEWHLDKHGAIFTIFPTPTLQLGSKNGSCGFCRMKKDFFLRITPQLGDHLGQNGSKQLNQRLKPKNVQWKWEIMGIGG